MSRSDSYGMIAALLVSATVLMPVPAYAAMCANCAGQPHIMSIGKCGSCGVATSSGAFTLCPACSVAQNKCEACGAALAVALEPAVTPPASTANPATTPVAPPSATVNPATTPVAPPSAADKPEAKSAIEAPSANAVPVPVKP